MLVVRFTSIVLLLTLSFHSTSQNIDSLLNFPIPQEEVNCMQHFDFKDTNVNSFNAFILSKMNELMYQERLDYQLRYLTHGRKPLTYFENTSHFKSNLVVNNSNFKEAFEARFKHYFPKEDSAHFYFFHATVFLDAPYLPKNTFGLDPEVIVIKTTRGSLVLFRGTDDVGPIRLGEWVGTDFNALKEVSPYLNNSRVHRGFYNSYDLVRHDLMELLQNEENPIWISGHSLGGGQGIICAVDLAMNGYPIHAIYTYCAPNSIGNRKFKRLYTRYLSGRLHRFEYYNDPVPIFWIPGYVSFGQRHFVEQDGRIHFNYPLRSFLFRKDKSMNTNKNILAIPMIWPAHNPQFITKSLRKTIDNQLIKNTPNNDDSYPFLYYALD